MILEALGQFVDVLRWPARHFHAEMQTHLGQHFLDLVQRLAAEVRGAQHFRFRLLNEVADVHDVVFFRQFAERTESSSSSTFLRNAGLNARSGMISCATSLRGSSKLTKTLS